MTSHGMKRIPHPTLELLDALERDGGTFEIEGAAGVEHRFTVDLRPPIRGRRWWQIAEYDADGTPAGLVASSPSWAPARAILAARCAELGHERARVRDTSGRDVEATAAQRDIMRWEITAADPTWQVEVTPAHGREWFVALYVSVPDGAALIDGKRADVVDLGDGSNWYHLNGLEGGLGTWPDAVAWVDRVLASLVLLDARPPLRVVGADELPPEAA